MIEVRVSQKDFMDHMHAVGQFKFQQRRHDAHPNIDQGMSNDLAAVSLNEREGDVCLPIGIGGSNFLCTLIGGPEFGSKSRLNAVDSYQ
jgi:hypothetical protein